MRVKRLFSENKGCKTALLIALAAVVALICASCSSSEPSAAASSSSSVAASPSPSPSVQPAVALLKQAEAAAKGLKNYDFVLDLTQKLSGHAAGDNSTATVDMQGRTELGPLKLDQLVKTNTDGEVYEIRGILVPDGYYMYDPEFEEWSKTPKADTADMVKTFSDFQINPAKAIAGIQSLGSELKLDESGGQSIISYEGNGPEAKAFLENVLESSLDLSGMEPKVRESIKLGVLKLNLVIDPATHWPVSYKIESVMTVEYEAGKPSTLAQTMTGSYSKHNASKAVVVPEAARNAP